MTASLLVPSPGKPLMLKDFLRADPNSDSFGGGFRTAPRRPDQTVRYLLTVEAGDANSADGGGKLPRSRSRGVLTKITAVINAVKLLPFAAAASSSHSLPKQGIFLTRSFSRKLRRSFWKKREKGEHREENNKVRAMLRVRDIVRLRSFGNKVGEEEMNALYLHPFPVASNNSCSSGWSEIDSSVSDFLPSSSCGTSEFSGEDKNELPEKDHKPGASPTRSVGVGEESTETATSYQTTKREEREGGGMRCPSCPYEDEKEQLSPVSVMDFPCEAEEDDTAADEDKAPSPSFHESLANIERTKHQLMQKIRRFESLAALVDPVDLDECFASFENELESDGPEDEEELEVPEEEEFVDFEVEIEERAVHMLDLVKSRNDSSGRKPKGNMFDGLLVDFFIEGLSSSRCAAPNNQIWRRRRLDQTLEKEAAAVEEIMLRSANDWINGYGKAENINSREALVLEMERNGRWRCHDEEEEEIAGALEGLVLESLLEELVPDLKKGELFG